MRFSAEGDEKVEIPSEERNSGVKKRKNKERRLLKGSAGFAIVMHSVAHIPRFYVY